MHLLIKPRFIAHLPVKNVPECLVCCFQSCPLILTFCPTKPTPALDNECLDDAAQQRLHFTLNCIGKQYGCFYRPVLVLTSIGVSGSLYLEQQ